LGLSFAWLGRQAYVPMWQKLQQRVENVATGSQPEVVWTCEHEPVYTTGRRSVDNRLQARLDAPLIHTDRGGEMTFHGPGQVMLYPVISLRRHGIPPRDYVRLLEQSCIDLLAGLGVESGRREGLPGVWVQTGKIAAIGLRISRGVAYHGMALNVNVAPGWFETINACGTGWPSVNLHSLISHFQAPEILADQWAVGLSCLLPHLPAGRGAFTPCKAAAKVRALAKTGV